MKEDIPYWKILTVLIGFPCIYQLYSVSPFSIELFQKSNNNFFIPFFLGTIFLHISTFLICVWLMKTSHWGHRDIGFLLSKKQTIQLLIAYFTIALVLLVGVELVLNNVTVDTSKVNKLGNFFPKTLSQRIVFIFTAFSAGFCEEYIYRGFAIRSLESKGIPLRISLIISSISFTFIHGIVVFERFHAYFFPSLVFGILFIWTKKLAIPMFVHAIIDLTAILMILKTITI